MDQSQEIAVASEKRRNIVSPWRDVAEFRELCEWIYGEMSSPKTWQQAVQELRIWINRRRSQCPAAVYATHAMLEVKLTDSRDKMEVDELRSLYAFALVRFFNFMSSTIQTHNMRSMYTTAIELGLESFVVDIRHTCAHGTELPELSILRHTADYCLNWLHDYYWRVKSEKMFDADVSCLKKRDMTLQKCSRKIGHLFGLYDIVLECCLNRCETMKEIKQKIRGRQLANFKEFWKSKNLKTMKEALDVIVLDMVAIMKSGVGRKHLTGIFVREFMKMKYFFAVTGTHNSGLELENLIGIVQNLFRFLAVYNVIEMILQRLFETAEMTSADVTQKYRAGASFWAKYIVEGFAIFIRCKKMFHVSFDEDHLKSQCDHNALNFGNFSNNVRETYIYSGVNLKRSIIFGDDFQRPWVWHFNRDYVAKRTMAVNEFTAPILPSLWTLVKPKMNENEITRLQELTRIYLIKNSEENLKENNPDKTQVNGDDKIYTIDDVLPCKKSDKNDKSMESLSTNGWTMVNNEEYDWSKCAIGRLPWH